MANILGGSSKDTFFNNGMLKIYSNLFTTEDAFIQIANISQVRIARLPQSSYRIVVITAFLAIVCFNFHIATLGYVLLGIAVALGIYIRNRNNDNKYGLFLDLNSGSSIIYASPDKAFLKVVANVLAKVVAGSYRDDIVINFTDNSIRDVHGAVVTGGQVDNITNMGV